MDDVRTTRDMEDFLINPTYPHVAMDGDPGPALLRPESHVSTTTSSPPDDRVYSWKGQHKNASLSVVNALSHFSWQSYASEEEPASPVDTDDMSARSPSPASCPRRIPSEESLPELLERTGDDAEQQCNEAQAVRVVVAGRAKVVSMPRLVDNASRKKRPTTIMHISPASRKGSTDAASQTSSLDSRRDTPRTSAEGSPSSPASTTPSSVDDADEPPPDQPKTTLRRRPSLPHLNTSLTPPAPPMPSPADVRQAVDYWERQPIPPVERRPSMPLSPGLRKLQKISSSLAMNLFKKDPKQVSREDDIAEEPEPTPPSPMLAPAPAGRPRLKMVARAPMSAPHRSCSRPARKTTRTTMSPTGW
ncbi:hypothetical protein Tdes44962_MAKER06158 [Teratosphaeria destructans]|uniref:Uncharacterized protein n=1 Tax=Teratosphaeria destructans TaxID=418781 RepID=A0A9W7SHX8_9PEZI|nr:hypothetical protein Tdes44962_MAKER06158 [Teratosphaeria destructans]